MPQRDEPERITDTVWSYGDLAMITARHHPNSGSIREVEATGVYKGRQWIRLRGHKQTYFVTGFCKIETLSPSDRADFRSELERVNVRAAFLAKRK